MKDSIKGGIARIKWQQWRQEVLRRLYEEQTALGDWFAGVREHREAGGRDGLGGSGLGLGHQKWAELYVEQELSANANLQQIMQIYWKEKEIITTKQQFDTSQAHCSNGPDLWDARHCHCKWGGGDYSGIKIYTTWMLRAFVEDKRKGHA